MDKNEDSGSPGWGASSLMQTTEDVARAFFAAASAATARSARPSVVFSSNDENTGTQLQKLQNKITSVFRSGSLHQHETKGTYNPEVLTSQKRQWTRFQLQSLKYVKEPSTIFESMVVVGLHPNTDYQVLQKIVLENGNEDLKKSRGLLSYNHQVHAEPNLEPQVLFVYPPEKQLPLKSEDLISFCFPGGVEVHAVERTPSLSELNEILLGQEQLKQSNQSFVFRLQVADDSSLYGCCILVDEIVQKPSNLVSMLVGEKACSFPLSHRHIMTTSRCYCILSRLPFFDLHFGILRSIFIEERLERLIKGVHMLNLLSSEETVNTNGHVGTDIPVFEDHAVEDAPNSRSHLETSPEVSPKEALDNEYSIDNQLHDVDLDIKEGNRNKFNPEATRIPGEVVSEVVPKLSIQNIHDNHVHEVNGSTQPETKGTDAALPLQCHIYESSEASSSFQGFLCEDRTFRGEVDEDYMDEPSSSNKKDSDHHDVVLEWAKANRHGSLQLICEYYKLKCPVRGSILTFHPLEHLHPLEFHRPSETSLHIAGSTVDLRSLGTSIEVAEARTALLAEEEATILSVWTVATLCGCLRLDHVLTMFAGALLEKQIVVVCSNLGILSASVLSVIPLICPYQWQCLLMPVLPNHMLEFLDAPVPYIVGVKNKTADMQTRLANVIVVDVNKNQVKAPSMPQLPRQKELLSSLSPYHARLVGESYLARKRPVYECTDVQIEAAKGFLAVLRSYLDSLCSNLRSHTITNVQSNNDKISLLLKESFIDSFTYRHRPFMKLFVDTQLFSVHTDLILSFYQKD